MIFVEQQSALEELINVHPCSQFDLPDDEQQCVFNDCVSSQFDSCDEDMEAAGEQGQGECLYGGKSHPHPLAPQRPSYSIVFP
jgi:hypothetical protein